MEEGGFKYEGVLQGRFLTSTWMYVRGFVYFYA